MTTIIAIYLLLGAVSSGNKITKERPMESNWGSIGAVVLHLWFGVWMLLNL